MIVRAFIAIGLPVDSREAIEKISASSAARISGVRWVPPENFHLTLKFLGDVEEAVIPDIQSILNQVTPRYLPITCRFGNLGVFPKHQRTRIIWLGVTEGSDQLAKLADDLSIELSHLGFKSEKRKYTPHLTLGRVKKGADTAQLKNILREAEKNIVRLGDSTRLLNINMLLLQKSILTSKGAIYQILSEH